MNKAAEQPKIHKNQKVQISSTVGAADSPKWLEMFYTNDNILTNRQP